MRDQIIVALVGIVIAVGILWVVVRYGWKHIPRRYRAPLIFSSSFFVIVLLPFLGLGNITSRYSYAGAIGIVFLLALGIKLLYVRLIDNGRLVSLMSVGIVLFTFSLFHTIQLHRVENDWNTAGKKVVRFFDTIDAGYQEFWSTEPMTFYFVNVPLQTGDAWIFPVGLEDGLWLTLRNPNITVNKSDTLEQALSAVRDPKHEKVYVFDDSGSVTERIPDLSQFQ